MPEPIPKSHSAFDDYAGEYDAALQRGLDLSGESKEYFARERVRILRDTLERYACRPTRILDFGCGTGGSIQHLASLPGKPEVWGVDPSEASICIAGRDHPQAIFRTPQVVSESERFDLIFCNGVFHHIPPADRTGVLDWIRARMAPEAWFALWENNPWNLGTRWVMSRIPFDRDAVTLSPPEARRMLSGAGLAVVEQTFAFYFPSALKALRPLEPRLARLPLGAQYQTIARLERVHGRDP